MRKYIATIIFLLLGLAILAPSVALAAYNDVTFPEGITVTIGDHDYTIDPSSVLEEFAVSATTLTVEMEVGSRLIISSAERMKMINDSGTDTDCSKADMSTLDITGTANLTVVIEPSGTCGTAGGGGGGGGGAAPEPEPEPEPETIVGEETVTTGEGGTVTATADDGGEATVEVPADAVLADTVITVTPVGTAESIAGDPPTGSFMVGGYVYQFSATADGEAVTSFDQDLTLTFTYTDSQTEGLDESSLTVYRWDADVSEWVALDTTVDADNNTVTATTTEFSEFALMGEEEEEELIEEMTAEELRAMIVEIQEQLVDLLQQLIVLIQEQINQLLQES